MKKFVYLLLCALPLFAATSCDDDNDLPDVDINIQISDAVFADGRIYAVAGTDFEIDGISVVNNEHGKSAIIPYANYYFDYQYIGQSVIEPYGYNIYLSEDIPAGNHLLEITMPVYAVDKSPAFAALAYEVVVVESADDLPQTGTTATISHPSLSDTDPSK